MSEFTLNDIKAEDLAMNQANLDQYFKNVKEIKVGNGRWKQDSTAFRGYDTSGNCDFIIELEQ